MEDIIIMLTIFFIMSFWVNSQIESIIENKNNKLEKNLKEYEQKEKAGKQKSKV